MGSQGESQEEELRGAQRPPHAIPIPNLHRWNSGPRRLRDLSGNSQFSVAELAGGSESPTFLPAFLSSPQITVDQKAVTESQDVPPTILL